MLQTHQAGLWYIRYCITASLVIIGGEVNFLTCPSPVYATVSQNGGAIDVQKVIKPIVVGSKSRDTEYSPSSIDVAVPSDIGKLFWIKVTAYADGLTDSCYAGLIPTGKDLLLSKLFD